MEKSVSSFGYSVRFDPFRQDCLDLFKELSIDTLLYRSALIASAQTNACYCICATIGPRGRIEKYHLFGLTPAEVTYLTNEAKNADLPLFYDIQSASTLLTTTFVDCQSHPIFSGKHPFISSLLYVPILYGDKKIGSIILMNKVGALRFTKNDSAVIEMLATYSGIAINNASIYLLSAVRERALSKRNEDLALLNALSRVFVNFEGKTEDLVEEAMSLIKEYIGITFSELFLNRTESPEEFHLIYKTGHTSATSIFGLSTVSYGVGLLGEVIKSRKSYTLSDDELEVINEKHLIKVRIDFIAMIPILTGKGVFGLICLGLRKTPGTMPVDMRFLDSIASWTGMLIENLRLAQQQQKIAILEERNRIGMDLHDGVIQSIYGVGLMLENARITAVKEPEKAAGSIKTAIDALNETIRDIRSYIMGLKPDQLTHENFVQSLRLLVNNFHSTTMVSTDFSCAVEHIEFLTKEQLNMFYMICKEALSNIAKHAHAAKVNVYFDEKPNRFVLTVKDNGLGFDTKTERRVDSHGITNMNARAKDLGGDIEIISAVGKGTIIIAWLPNDKEMR